MGHSDPIYISVSWTQHTFAEYLDKHYDDFVKHIQITEFIINIQYIVLIIHDGFVLR